VAQDWETREQLLEAASSAGYPLSPAQLGRLHRAGLVPAPLVRALGRGRGTESRFPLGSADRLVRVAEVHTKVHRLSDVAWRLWWQDGGEMPPPALDALRRVAASVDAQREELATLLQDNDAGTPEGEAGLDKLYTDAERSHLPGPLAELRRNIGREHFGSVVHGLGTAATGRAQDTAYTNEELDALLRRMFGFDPDQRAGEGDQSPAEDREPLVLQSFSELSLAQSATELANRDSSELDLARVQARAMSAMLSAAASLFDRFGSPGAPSLGPASRMPAGERPHDQMLFLLGVLALRSSDELRVGLDEIQSVSAPQAVTSDHMSTLICRMREAIPELAEPMSDDRLAAAIHDVDAAAELHAEIRQLREKHTAKFDAFFAAHPEASDLITAFDETTRDRS
jgi:hypothetical protein